MPTERRRHGLYETCREHLGEEAADTLMELLPPVGWADVTTKHDLQQATALLRTELHAEIAGLRAELHTEIGSLRADLHTEISSLRAEMHAEVSSLEVRLTDKMAAQTRTLMLALVGSMMTISGVAFGAARLAA